MRPFLLFSAVLVAASAAALPPPASARDGARVLAVAASADTAAFRRQVADVLEEVARVRALEPRRPVEPLLQTRDELTAYVVRQLEREDNARRLRVEGLVLGRLGLLPPGYLLPDSLVEIYREQIGGVYDYHSDRLLLADWISPDLQIPVIAHELVHALQDQRYDIGARLDSLLAAGDDDGTQSFLALAEGDATAVMLEFFASSLGMTLDDLPGMSKLLPQLLGEMKGQTPRLAAAPRVVQESLLFPYVHGAEFVLAVRERMPWSEFAKIYARPPSSSSDILHPDLYLAGPRPRPRVRWAETVVDPERPGRDENTFGEWGLRLLLSNSLPDSVAEHAAAGWTGDRCLLLGADGGTTMLFLGTTWENEAEAEEFSAALQAKIFGSERITHVGFLLLDAMGMGRIYGGEMAWFETRGERVVLVIGDPASLVGDEAFAARREDVWRAFLVEPPD